MAGDTDFLTLYEELGLPPGVNSVNELKQAYRRRVVQLHPDRSHGTPDGMDEERLQRLTSLYGAAIAFERRFGRLPGAEAPPTRRAVITPAAGHPVAPAASGAGMRREFISAPEPRSLRKRILIALLILMALAWAIWGVGTIAQ